jgi:hypothetical protein
VYDLRVSMCERVEGVSDEMSETSRSRVVMMGRVVLVRGFGRLPQTVCLSVRGAEGTAARASLLESGIMARLSRPTR